MNSSLDCIFSPTDIYDLQKFNYPWPTEDLDAICRNFELDDYEALVSKTPIDYAIFVQVLNHEAGETGASHNAFVVYECDTVVLIFIICYMC